MTGPRVWLLALLAQASAACATGSSNTLAGAAVTTAAGLGTAAASRAMGGCVAICTNGTACNPKTGLCDAVPPAGAGWRGQRCEQTFTEVKCVPAAESGVSSVAADSASAAPAQLPVLPATAPASSSGPPIVVPKAEEQPPK